MSHNYDKIKQEYIDNDYEFLIMNLLENKKQIMNHF